MTKHGGKRNGAGRPAGSPNKVSADMRAQAQLHGEAAIQRLVELMRSEDPRASIAACKEILDRGYGKPPQAVTIDAEGTTINVSRIELVAVSPTNFPTEVRNEH